MNQQQLATICYLDNGESYLLLYRNKKPQDVHKGKWIGVGGKFEEGESPQDCARREILEETGLRASQLELRGVITFPNFTPGKDWVTFVFVVPGFEGTLKACDEGTLAWVPYDQVLDKPTWEGDRIFLAWLLERQPFFSAKFCYEAGRLDQYEVDFYGKSDLEAKS